MIFYLCLFSCVFFFNDPATTEIYTYLHTLSLHDALPILGADRFLAAGADRDFGFLAGTVLEDVRIAPPALGEHFVPLRTGQKSLAAKMDRRDDIGLFQPRPERIPHLVRRRQIGRAHG